MKGYQYWWIAGGYDLENRTVLEVASMVVTWWIVSFYTDGLDEHLCIFHNKLQFIPISEDGSLQKSSVNRCR